MRKHSIDNRPWHSDPQHTIPRPGADPDMIADEIKDDGKGTESETGPHLYAHSDNPEAGDENPESLVWAEQEDMPVIGEKVSKLSGAGLWAEPEDEPSEKGESD